MATKDFILEINPELQMALKRYRKNAEQYSDAPLYIKQRA